MAIRAMRALIQIIELISDTKNWLTNHDAEMRRSTYFLRSMLRPSFAQAYTLFSIVLFELVKAFGLLTKRFVRH